MGFQVARLVANGLDGHTRVQGGRSVLHGRRRRRSRRGLGLLCQPATNVHAHHVAVALSRMIHVLSWALGNTKACKRAAGSLAGNADTAGSLAGNADTNSMLCRAVLRASTKPGLEPAQILRLALEPRLAVVEVRLIVGTIAFVHDVEFAHQLFRDSIVLPLPLLRHGLEQRLVLRADRQDWSDVDAACREL